MINALSLNISSMGFFGGVKTSDARLSFVDVNMSCPLVLILNYASKSRFISGMLFAYILGIGLLGYISEIGKSVVATVAVYMVNVKGWIHAFDVKPSKTMAIMQLFIKPENNITLRVCGGYDVADFGFFTDSHKSSKYAGCWIVIKYKFQAFLGNHNAPLGINVLHIVT